jgi:hypothetical protein
VALVDLDGRRWSRAQLLRRAALGAAALLVPADRVLAAAAAPAAVAERWHSRPTLDPPVVTVTATGSDPAEGYFFIAPFGAAGLAAATAQTGPLIVDAQGHVVWFRELPAGTAATDFRVQHYRGNPVLTWWEGEIQAGFGFGQGVVLDAGYGEVVRVSAGNGYQADLHEFLLTPENTALITAYDRTTADLSAIGGAQQGAVLDSIVQEVDPATGRVLFEWHSLDHVGLDESQNAPPASGSTPFDHFHVNSVGLDDDGDLLVSSRHTWTIYKLDRQTGEIQWRLGGSKSDFTFGERAAFAWQHDARRRPDGTISVFDNAASSFPTLTEPQSRGLVLDVDTKAMTASLAGEYIHPTGLVVVAMGNLQTLPGGEVTVGWGVVPQFTQHAVDGTVALDGSFPTGGQSYRAYRLPWTAHPGTAPSVAAEPNADGSTTVYARRGRRSRPRSSSARASRCSPSRRSTARARCSERRTPCRALNRRRAPRARSSRRTPRGRPR